MKQTLFAIFALSLLGSEARAELILPYRNTIGNWFIYHDDTGCTAVTEAWGRSFYMSQDQRGWRFGSDAPIFRNGTHPVEFDGTTVPIDFYSRDGLAEFNVPTWGLAQTRMASYVDLVPEGRNGLFSLHQASRAIDSIVTCFRNEGTSASRVTRYSESPFGPNCPEKIDVKPTGRAWNRVTFENTRDLPVLIYEVNREGVRSYQGPVKHRRALDSYDNSVFLVTDSQGNCLGDPLVVEGEDPVFRFE